MTGVQSLMPALLSLAPVAVEFLAELPHELALWPGKPMVVLGDDQHALLAPALALYLFRRAALAVIPLMLFVGDKKLMDDFRPPAWMIALGWASAALVVTINVKLLADMMLDA